MVFYYLIWREIVSIERLKHPHIINGLMGYDMGNWVFLSQLLNSLRKNPLKIRITIKASNYLIDSKKTNQIPNGTINLTRVLIL